MTARLYVASSPGELRLAVLRDGVLVAAELHRAGAPDRVDERQLARVGAAATGASGWFVRLSDADAFLPAGEVPRPRRPLREGEAVVVRIARAAMGGKGLRVSMKRAGEAPAGLTAPARLAAAPDALARLAAMHDAAIAPGEEFPPEVDEQFALLAEPEQALPGGGRLRVYPTPAATLIDIDAGSLPPAEANLRAAAEAARAITSRNLSGVILVDFAALDGAEARRRAQEALAAALAADPLRAGVTGHSPAGLVEVVRRKIRPPLHELLGEANPPFRPSALTHGLAALRRTLAEALARPALRPALRAHPCIIAALEADPAALAAFATRAGARLVLRADEAMSWGMCAIEDARDGR